MQYLEFEKPIEELVDKLITIEKLKFQLETLLIKYYQIKIMKEKLSKI